MSPVAKRRRSNHTTPAATLVERASGVLLHPTSLPGVHGCGDLGPEAYRFVDWLAAAGQRWWQMLPVGPPGVGNSPYSALSAFAGSPLLISLDRLAAEGLLAPEDLAAHPPLDAARVDYVATAAFRARRLRLAFEAFRTRPGERRRLAAYAAAQRDWLDDYALFAALRERHRQASWVEWAPDLRGRRHGALRDAAKTLATDVEYQRFLQWQFDLQWRALRHYAAERGVRLIGDLPFYVAHDSADVWAHSEVFELAADGRPTAVAGVPPDLFSATGQLWGNPLYRWTAMRHTRFRWWVARIRRTLERFDAVRLDHFIGFHRVWRVPAGAKTAEIGRWERSPGADLLGVMRRALGGLPFLVEDLGLVTPEVAALRDRFALPGTRVLQFAFDGDPANIHRPHTYPRRAVVCTGTHDHDTMIGWLRTAPARVRERLLDYAGSDGAEPHWDAIRLALSSVADLAILPMQDVLGLGSEARMNLPATSDGNWEWRLPNGELGPAGERLARACVLYGRARRREESRGG